MNKNQIKQLKKKLIKENKLAFDQMTKKQVGQMESLCDDYKSFLNDSKTEREAVRTIVRRAENKGFKNISKIDPDSPSKLNSFFKSSQDRCIALVKFGKQPIKSGVNIIASHIDSPRLDLKQNPLYEDLSLGLLKTHYYGGIRKYQWLALPLALHGTIVTSNNDKININIGEAPNDPVFTVTDLLPHLAGKLQSGKKISEVFQGEKLNLLSGSFPLGNKDEKDRVKLNLLNILFEKYKIKEEDFISAELEAVPAEKSRDVGFDRSLIGAYGQDDRICAFTSLEAILSLTNPDKTAIALFFDKEEIGSEGATAAKSSFLEDLISDTLFITGNDTGNRVLRKTLIHSSCLSADVNAAIDPDYKEVHESLNAAKLGFGVCMTKFTGVAGKAGSSDASAEFVGKIRNIFNKNKVIWQTGELGKIDEGGGGTVAKFLAKYGMDVLDCGPALLSMHSPFEISSKADIFMTYLAYKAFYEDNE